MVDFEPIGQVSYSRSPFVCVCDDDDLVTSIDQLGGKLINVRFDSARLGEEEVADHGNVVRHFRRDLFTDDGATLRCIVKRLLTNIQGVIERGRTQINS